MSTAVSCEFVIFPITYHLITKTNLISRAYRGDLEHVLGERSHRALFLEGHQCTQLNLEFAEEFFKIYYFFIYCRSNY